MKERFKNDKKFRKNVILAIIMLLIMVGASVYTVFIKPNLNTEVYVYKEETVARGDLILGIMESGSVTLGESAVVYELELEDEDSDDSEDEDGEEEEIKYLELEEVYVVSGQRVKAGDMLFKFTDESVKAVRRRLNTTLTESQIALSEAQTEYNTTLITAKSTYDSSMLTGQRADSEYQATLTESEQNVTSKEAQIQILELEIAQAQEKLEEEDWELLLYEAQVTYNYAKVAYEETEVYNATAYYANLEEFEAAEAALEQIKEEMQGYQDTIEKNTEEIAKLQQEIENAKTKQILSDQDAVANYQKAKIEGELAAEIYEYNTASLADSVTQAETEWSNIQSKVDTFESFVGNDNIVYATEDGFVTGVFYEAGDDLIQNGNMMTYTTEDNYTVSIDVSEEDVSAISIGDEVTLTFSAYPEQEFPGTIISITTSATSDHANTISYPVTIKVDGDTSLLYGGMTADVTFVTESVSDVLYVSKKAVFEEDGKQWVYKKNASGDREKTEVETGFSDMTSVEIVSGLSEGDVVYIESVMNSDAEQGREEEQSTDIQSMDGFEMPDMGGEMPDGFEMPDMGGEMPDGFEMPDMGGTMPGGGRMPQGGNGGGMR